MAALAIILLVNHQKNAGIKSTPIMGTPAP